MTGPSAAAILTLSLHDALPILAIVDRIGETLKRWLLAQLLTMFAVFAVTWIGLALIGIQGSFILGIQAGLLAFIPTVGDRKSTRLNSSHMSSSYAVFCLKKIEI